MAQVPSQMQLTPADSLFQKFNLNPNDFSDQDLFDEENHSNEHRFGLYHLWLPIGNEYTIVFKSQGYENVIKKVQLNRNGLQLNIKMKKNK